MTIAVVRLRSREELERFIRRHTEEDDLFVNDKGELCSVGETVSQVWRELKRSGIARLILDDLVVVLRIAR